MVAVLLLEQNKLDIPTICAVRCNGPLGIRRALFLFTLVPITAGGYFPNMAISATVRNHLLLIIFNTCQLYRYVIG